MGKWAESWRIFRRCLKDPEFRAQVESLGQEGEEEIERVGAVRMLARFQEEGRLVDFLKERIDGYDDAQVGSAVKVGTGVMVRSAPHAARSRHRTARAIHLCRAIRPAMSSLHHRPAHAVVHRGPRSTVGRYTQATGSQCS